MQNPLYLPLTGLQIPTSNFQSQAYDARVGLVMGDWGAARDYACSISINTGEALIDEIMLHRRIELWSEGHRWIDLKRLQEDLVRPTVIGNRNPGMAYVLEVPAGDKTWNWLIPRDELELNDAIREEDQNP